MNNRSSKRCWVVAAAGAIAGVVAFIRLSTLEYRTTTREPADSKAVRLIHESKVVSQSTVENRVIASSKNRFAEKGTEETWFLPELTEVTSVLNAPGATAAQDISILEELLSLYRRANEGNNPIAGSNEQVVEQLRGHNAKRFALLPPDFSGISPTGQLLDRWGSPYFFHALSHEKMEIRSAGPDRAFWTGDDIQPSWMAPTF